MADAWDVSGKSVVITGASDGIGAAAARLLAARGAHLALVGRSEQKLTRVATDVRAIGGGHEPLTFTSDFSSLDDVRKLANDVLEQMPQIHILANNAGGIWPRRELTSDGHERTFQVNHLAPFLLTALLRERLVASAPSRVITTSSDAHRGARLDLADLDFGSRRFSEFQVYGTTKLENILFTRELARRLDGTGVLATCFHPGTVATGFGRDSWFSFFTARHPVKFFFRTPEQGADTLVWLATASAENLTAGEYYADRKAGRRTAATRDDALARDLWAKTAEILGTSA